MIVGLTGMMASGKSTVSSIMKKYGGDDIEILDADHLVKGFMTDDDVREYINNRFDSSKDIDFHKEILKDNSILDEMEKLLHPKLQNYLEERMNVAESRHIVFDYPLLFETESDEYCDIVVLCDCEDNVRVARYMERSKPNFHFMKFLESRLISISKKREDADVIIDTSKTLINTENQVFSLMKKLGLVKKDQEFSSSSKMFDFYTG